MDFIWQGSDDVTLVISLLGAAQRGEEDVFV